LISKTAEVVKSYHAAKDLAVDIKQLVNKCQSTASASQQCMVKMASMSKHSTKDGDTVAAVMSSADIFDRWHRASITDFIKLQASISATMV
jgi:hypothetical protein